MDVANEGAVELAVQYKLPSRSSAGRNIISFETKRYVEGQALVVRGPGAGAEVTAGGVFGDVLRVCQYLGAPS